jgi:DNA primase
MSGRIRDEDVAYIRDRAPIDEIVGEYVQLKSAGGGQKKGLWRCHRIFDEDRSSNIY